MKVCRDSQICVSLVFGHFKKLNIVNIIVYICRYIYMVHMMCLVKLNLMKIKIIGFLDQECFPYAEYIDVAFHGEFMYIA